MEKGFGMKRGKEKKKGGEGESIQLPTHLFKKIKNKNATSL